MTTTTDHASQGEIFDFCNELLSQQRVISLEDLEAAVAGHFGERLNMEPMPGKRGKVARLHWQNSVDWVKASWTSHGKTTYVSVGKVTYVVWLPTVGYVDGQGTLANWQETAKTLQAVAKFFD